jgi:chromosomal replication initiation ATPase DnaA
VTRPSFETWLSKTVCYAIIGRVLFITVPNVFVAEMLEQRMWSLIHQTTDRVCGFETSVEFVVAGEEESPG